MGLSSRKQKSTTVSNSNSTATTTPNAPAWIQGPATDYYGRVGGLLSQPPTTHGPSGLQQRAFTQAASLGGANPAYADALNGSRSLLNYTPDNVSAPGAYTPSLVSGRTVNAPTINAGQLKDADLSPYMDPWTHDVIDASLGDIERFRGMGINQNQSDATSRGAFSNSRLGLERAATNEAALRNAGLLSSQLRSQGFQRAQDMALTDIGNRFGADQFNAGNAFQASLANADSGQRADLANQQAGLAAGLAGNADRMQALLANQQAGLAGANFRLGAANQLGSQALAGEANSRANIGLLSGLGGEERAIAQENDPQSQQLRLLAQIQGLLGIDPSMFIGQTATGQESGSSTTKTTQTPSGLDALAQIMKIGASMGLGKPGGGG